jgi:hypothetical protein
LTTSPAEDLGKVALETEAVEAQKRGLEDRQREVVKSLAVEESMEVEGVGYLSVCCFRWNLEAELARTLLWMSLDVLEISECCIGLPW